MDGDEFLDDGQAVGVGPVGGHGAFDLQVLVTAVAELRLPPLRLAAAEGVGEVIGVPDARLVDQAAAVIPARAHAVALLGGDESNDLTRATTNPELRDGGGVLAEIIDEHAG